jgi:tellurite resistance protein TerC
MKRYAKIIGGFTLLIAGIAMIALPGPGWLTIALALAILAGEYVWARNLLDRLKRVGGKLRKSPPERPDTPAS